MNIQGRIQDLKLGGQKILFFSNFRGGARRVRPPLDPPLIFNVWIRHNKG